VSEKRVYVVTSKGNAELTGANTSLSAEDLKILVLVDGYSSVAAIAKQTENQLPVTAVAQTLDRLEKAGFIADPDATASINVGDFFKESETGLASLQAAGFYVRIARRDPERPAPAKDHKVTVLAVEDDPALTKLLRTYMRMEGFNVRLAATREEIMKGLVEEPKPDVVLLDVVLPDTDGFDVLAKIRSTEQVKAVPVIMTTAKATREAVLKGLRGGANGYVTKPFDMDIVLKAIRTVLGLKG
jgi:two-component system, OmpR family, response regulator